MKVAVTGATGFVGRHVLHELSKRNVQTIAISRFSSVEDDLAILDNTQWVCLDMSQPVDECYKKLYKPDMLIHLAWEGLPNYQSLHHFEKELPTQYRFISTLVREGLKNLIVVGTCFEYGMQWGPLSADMETKPTNPYGFAKDALRKQLQYLKLTSPFNFTWARLFYIYGEGQTETSLFPALKKAVSLDHKVFEMSGGEQLRDYLPVQEVARRLVDMALDCKDRGVVNICSGVPVSVRKLVESWIIENRWNIDLRLGKFPYPEHEPMSFWGR